MKRAVSFLLAVFSVSVLSLRADDERISRKEYIDTYKDLAVSQMVKYGIPASVTLAQACLESSDGNSRLSRVANNHFGIKCANWKGNTVRHDDDLPNECFRKYDSVEQSYVDHSEFLRYRDRYAQLFTLDLTDYKGWAYGLQAAGYATNPKYAVSLIKIIEENNLAQYDRIGNEIAEDVPPAPEVAEASFTLKPQQSSPLFKISLLREIREQNGVAYIVSNGKETYRSLAKEYNLFYHELLSFNDLKRGGGPIPAGTVIYLEKKKKESARHLEKHVVEEGETMYDLSQRYAVQLKYLYKYNNMKRGSEPAAGDIITLRAPLKK